MNTTPLADRIRPQTLDDVVGQKHLLGEGKLLRNIIENNEVPNMVFYGPSGVGKTTVANIIAAKTGKTLHRLNATTASVADIKHIVGTLDSFLAPEGVLLYLDEIQHFNKKQQQSLLEFMENGKITLIASTTENPYFYVYNAVLSRSIVFEFKPVSPEDVEISLRRAADKLSAELWSGFETVIDNDAITHLAHSANGDVRKALNALEAVFMAVHPDKDGKLYLTLDLAEQAAQKKALRYDKDGDSHYDILSAFQKSVRGSDPDAAVHYLARLIAAGDLPSICRRILVMASEDIGLAYPMAATIVNSCVNSALQLGLPEARIPLAEAVILLATAPKSNSAINAIDAALSDIKSKDTGDIPAHLKDSHYGGSKNLGHGIDYKYPHSYPNHYVTQQYLPDNIKDRKYYEYGDNKTENAAKAYWEKIKKKADER
ncbi:MAG: replication-associated recombination protein A [Oscillospiraceae bacterium]|nr:replication-associated recombination protein A [Oscillospiraceae bacterium]